MATAMKVDELRTELSNRGLSTAGIKPTLVKRLEAALRKEAETDMVAVAAVVGEKREREEEIENGKIGEEECDGIKERERLQKMSVIGLRKEASSRGVSTSGTKKELVERLCGDVDIVAGMNFLLHKFCCKTILH